MIEDFEKLYGLQSSTKRNKQPELDAIKKIKEEKEPSLGEKDRSLLDEELNKDEESKQRENEDTEQSRGYEICCEKTELYSINAPSH